MRLAAPPATPPKPSQRCRFPRLQRYFPPPSMQPKRSPDPARRQRIAVHARSSRPAYPPVPKDTKPHPHRPQRSLVGAKPQASRLRRRAPNSRHRGAPGAACPQFRRSQCRSSKIRHSLRRRNLENRDATSPRKILDSSPPEPVTEAPCPLLSGHPLPLSCPSLLAEPPGPTAGQTEGRGERLDQNDGLSS